MAKTSGEIEQEFINDLKSKTDQNLNDWIAIIAESGITKRNDIIKWLKESKSFRHMDASLLTGIYLNGGKPVYASEDRLLEDQLSKYENWRSLFNHISSKIIKEFPRAKMIPKKTYISFTEKREFAAINIKSREIRLGMDLGEQPFEDRLEKAKLTGPMPRISHMVVCTQKEDFDDQLVSWLNESYNRVN